MAPRRPSLAVVMLLAACAGPRIAAFGAEPGPIRFPDTQYEPVAWRDLQGWTGDDHAAAFAVFLRSCRALAADGAGTALTFLSANGATEQAITPAALKPICKQALAIAPLTKDGPRKFFEHHFRPLRISRLGAASGFLTGYYEPVIDGSLTPTAEFAAPLYRRPSNLVVSGRRKLGEYSPAKASRLAAASAAARLCPITRAARSRTARSTAGTWRSAGCIASSTCCSHRSKVRPAFALRTGPFCASITTRRTAGPIRRLGASSSTAIS